MGVLADYLEWVKARPGMYVGSREATPLYYFLAGFEEALTMTGRSDPVYAGFKEWLREHVLPAGEPSRAIAFRANGMSEENAQAHLFSLFGPPSANRCAAGRSLPR